MLTVKRLYELLQPHKDYPDLRILRVDTCGAALVVKHEQAKDESIAECVETVVQIAASVWRVTPENILSHRRPMQYVYPRMAVAKLLLDVIGLSDSDASRHMRKVRTAVQHMARQANKAIDTDRNFNVLYTRFEKHAKEMLYEESEIEWQSGDH